MVMAITSQSSPARVYSRTNVPAIATSTFNPWSERASAAVKVAANARTLRTAKADWQRSCPKTVSVVRRHVFFNRHWVSGTTCHLNLSFRQS
ncbi:hypothetical protein PISMIDRAFT_329908 [Pisolithus microcarpus 441]|uniref:Uncharacterized protein n=1 Tax=Pisolithus microcarpus 441 TaxID=765257 RepID=A0A0C9YYD4_9AGAM|nr:hypothetical protein PISMIDRAFT_329908 [Pisolithus microcarpus 441]